MAVKYQDVEHALQVLQANMAGDRETVERIITEHGEIGNALIGVACSLAEQLAIRLGSTPEFLLDTMLLEAARKATPGQLELPFDEGGKTGA